MCIRDSICIKGRPCKVVDVSTSKTGKHGHAKCHFVALDIFTGKKMEELCPSSHNAVVPTVTRKDYQIMDCESSEPGQPISLIDPETSECTDEFNMPPDVDLCIALFAAFETGDDALVTVVQAMDHAQIMSVRTTDIQ
eukprot:TRINITY_DN2398_c0_g1_i3.p1 TRINITY_DN2398_c0_g1~~TRINITY_DN2398_c0_g1_i3.p1  ORF type:complete len:138 (+),score=42.83 TRINITY_DN2398_c0_g1_i3:141-554(+)